MTPRFSPFRINLDLKRSLFDGEKAIAEGGLGHSLGELVRIRASQIDGCAMCINMHAIDARQNGESDMRIIMLDAWRDSPLHTDRERAALAWTESTTGVTSTGVPDADCEQVNSQFSEAEIVNLTVMIGAINPWNRLQTGARAVHSIQQSDRAAA